MTAISRIALFGKLDRLAFQTIESATVFCKMRGNPYVELAHWLHQILQAQDGDFHRILRASEVDPARLAADVVRALDRLPRGATAISDLSAHVEEAVERAWVYASLLMDARRIRTGHLLLGMLKTPGLRNVLLSVSPEFGRLRADDLAERFAALTAGSPEEASGPVVAAAQPGEASGALAPRGPEGEALARFCIDLTARARAGEIDPIVGRDDEIRQVIDVLMRRRQNNPILTGEAGVGKTAVVEGLALRIARGDVPPALREARLMMLDVGLLQAGASMKGEFEERLRGVIEEVQASAAPIVLFVDETHTLVGAGGAAGTGDAANLLKSALARGTLRTVGATTLAEYRRHIEKDPALSRRFQVVRVDEPDPARAATMLRGVAASLERHHGVQVLDEALEAAVRLSARYIPARQLPDKAVSALDTACARVAIGLHAVPAEVDDRRRRIEALETELAILARDEAAGAEVGTRREAARAAKAEAEAELATLETRWRAETEVVARILDLRARLRGDDAARPALAGASRDAARAELGDELAALAAMQGEAPLVPSIVDAQAVAAVVADWTGIPVGRMLKDEIATVLELEDRLAARVVGQDHAMATIARRIRSARAGLDDPRKPVGVFLLAGPSGVGKTETALALAETLHGGEQNLITINMSEYQEAHTVSALKGAPPGYVGHGEGGVLTEAVRRRPHSVVLLDEVEKAHPDVHELFFQVFDKGVMEDGEGRRIDFRDTLILLTSNVGSDQIMDLCEEGARAPDAAEMGDVLRGPLLEAFPAALLGRMTTVPYRPLSPAMIARIAGLQLDRVRDRARAAWGAELTWSPAVVETIVARCRELESGGRMIDAILTDALLPAVATEALGRMLTGDRIASVAVDVADGGFVFDFA